MELVVWFAPARRLAKCSRSCLKKSAIIGTNNWKDRLILSLKKELKLMAKSLDLETIRCLTFNAVNGKFGPAPIRLDGIRNHEHAVKTSTAIFKALRMNKDAMIKNFLVRPSMSEILNSHDVHAAFRAQMMPRSPLVEYVSLSENDCARARWYERRYNRRLTEMMKQGRRLSRLSTGSGMFPVYVGIDFGSANPKSLVFNSAGQIL